MSTEYLTPKTEQELLTCLSDPMWRLCSGNLYKIMVRGDDGSESLVIPFRPNESQNKLLNNLHSRNIILKARQLGFTTLIAIYFLDCVLFRPNSRAAIVAQSEDIAKTLFRDKVKFAYLNLPEKLREMMPLVKDSASELLFGHNNSSMRVATSARSGTLQYLHVSEFGKICADFPQRADEVVTGSIPAVPTNGVIFIESTAEGQDGHFYKMTKRAQGLEQTGNKLSKKDYKFYFFPWWVEPSYSVDPANVIITDKDHDYFDEIEGKMGCDIYDDQRAWWVSTRDSDYSGEADKMWREYPSTPDEAFQKSTEGCYYTVQIASARKQGRICKLPYRPGYAVNTFWDIGSSDGTAIWLHQRIGQFDNFIGFIEGWGEWFSHYVAEMQKLGYVWGTHYLPHDGNHVGQGQDSNLAPIEMLENLGLTNIEIVPRVSKVIHGIQATRNAFSTCYFDETACKNGIMHLESYRKKRNNTTGRFSDVPLHDIHSEAADAFRQFGQVQENEFLEQEYEEESYHAQGANAMGY